MKTVRTIFIFGFALLFAGCPARSFQSLFDNKNITPLPGLAGTWGENSDDNLFTFTPADDNTFTAVMREKGDSNTYVVKTGKIGSNWYADSYPVRDGAEYHAIGTHLIWKMIIKEDSLWMISLESDRLKELIDAKKLTMDHVERGNDIILTADTKDLRALVQRLATDPKAFPESKPLIRLK